MTELVVLVVGGVIAWGIFEFCIRPLIISLVERAND